MWLGLVAATALAQDVPAVNSQLYRVPLDAQHTLWTESTGARVVGAQSRPRFALQYVHRPLAFVPAGGGEPTLLVSDVLQLDAALATHFDRFRLALDLPVYLHQAGQRTADGFGIGDIATDLRVTLLDGADAPVGLAADARLAVPTASVPAPLGGAGLTSELFVAVDRTWGRTTGAVNIGGRFLPPSDVLGVHVDDQLVWRLGVGQGLGDAAGLSADLVGQVTLAAAASDGASPWEGLLGGWGRLAGSWVVRGGVGRGITPGVGAPAARVVTLLSYDPSDTGRSDLDADGIRDADDGCPEAPEDRDGFADDDGCPDPTQRVVVIAVDGSGVPLSAARIEIVGPQRATGQGSVEVELHGGAYQATAQADGFRMASEVFTADPSEGRADVRVTLQPDVPLGTLVLSVVDSSGALVDSAVFSLDGSRANPVAGGAIVREDIAVGAHKLVVRAPGFATHRSRVEVDEATAAEVLVELRPARVQVDRERIDVDGVIYFETGKAVIRADSHDLLDEIAGILVDHPELELVRIEGHTDSRGSASYNKRLSQQRAEAVLTYLVERDVEPVRLEAEGFGEERPVDPAEDAAAWEKNRRVDFTIARRFEP